MNEPEMKFSLDEIPENFNYVKENISDKDLKRLYSGIIFKYFKQNDINEKESYLFHFLKKYKFITYDITSFHQENKKESSNLVDSVVSFENHCLLIESIDVNSLHRILGKTNSIYIDMTSSDKKSIPIIEEISSFCSYFSKEIKNNTFVKLTIQSIAAFIIRRNYYPSNFFNDHSIFSFQKYSKKTDFVNLDQKEIIRRVEEDKEQNNNLFQTQDFDEKEFIFLRNISSNYNALFNLVIHIKTFYLFTMKKENNYENSYEVDFCNNYSHRCLTRFYGFVKKNGKIIGFIYEFMCNGTLNEYIENYKDEIDHTFSYMTLIRIIQGIKYLHSNSLIHRDIKPQNILIDHDNIPYLSDFNKIRYAEANEDMTNDIGNLKYSSPELFLGEKYSFPTDIFSLGQLIYFIYEKKDIFENVENSTYMSKVKSINISNESNIPDTIKNICQKCILYELESRPDINEIFNYFQEESKSFYFLETSYLKNIFTEQIIKPEIKQFYNEMYYLIFLSSDSNDNDYIHKHTKQLFQLINLRNESEISRMLFLVGKLYSDGQEVEQDFHKAKEYLDISAHLNNSDALHLIGKLYTFGQGVKLDYKKALEYFELSAQQNNSDAFNNLGNFYRYAMGVEQDYVKAKKYFKLSAKQNNVKGFCNLGLFYLFGYGVEKKVEKAIKYFEMAAKENFPDALNILGMIYLNGLGVDKDYEKSRNYFESAAKLGFPSSLLNLGEIYLYGKGVDKDYKKAINYFESAAKHNFDEAQYYLGIIHKNGFGVPKDYDRAKKYFEKAADNNFSLAIYQIGKLYYHGFGVKKDFHKAIESFEKAANQK
ncbi:hypothetical protein M9Y10_007219 [Tritrichomonas musculus]|uniref:Protein kinase domain-containing protein n=1 Tax=Tritrichomonas musculus TaxID=1915356 RepID=A0ABR2J0R7_9EUKA